MRSIMMIWSGNEANGCGFFLQDMSLLSLSNQKQFPTSGKTQDSTHLIASQPLQARLGSDYWTIDYY
jgi:hypothetical protein